MVRGGGVETRVGGGERVKWPNEEWWRNVGVKSRLDGFFSVF